jgi:hypothetical protein
MRPTVWHAVWTCGAIWRKSSYTGCPGDCVEVADLAPGQIGVRDSNAAPHSPVLDFDHAEWDAFPADPQELGPERRQSVIRKSPGT